MDGSEHQPTFQDVFVCRMHRLLSQKWNEIFIINDQAVHLSKTSSEFWVWFDFIGYGLLITLLSSFLK